MNSLLKMILDLSNSNIVGDVLFFDSIGLTLSHSLSFVSKQSDLLNCSGRPGCSFF